MERRKKVGPKGQIVIPKDIRDKLGIKEHSEALIGLRGTEIVIRQIRPVSSSYAHYFSCTNAKKLKHKVNLKVLMDEEYKRNLIK